MKSRKWGWRCGGCARGERASERKKGEGARERESMYKFNKRKCRVGGAGLLTQSTD